MCDSNSHGRMCNVAQSKIAPAHAEPAQEKSVIYRKKTGGRDGPVRHTPTKLARTLPLIDGGGLAGRQHLVPQSVQVGVFGRSQAEFDTGKLQHAARSTLLLLLSKKRVEVSEWR